LQKHRGTAAPRGVEVVEVKSSFFRCSLGCWLGLEVFVEVHSPPAEGDQTCLSTVASSFEGMCAVLLVSELVFLLFVTLDAVKVGFWRLKPIGFALT